MYLRKLRSLVTGALLLCAGCSHSNQPGTAADMTPALAAADLQQQLDKQPYVIPLGSQIMADSMNALDPFQLALQKEKLISVSPNPKHTHLNFESKILISLTPLGRSYIKAAAAVTQNPIQADNSSLNIGSFVVRDVKVKQLMPIEESFIPQSAGSPSPAVHIEFTYNLALTPIGKALAQDHVLCKSWSSVPWNGADLTDGAAMLVRNNATGVWEIQNLHAGGVVPLS